MLVIFQSYHLNSMLLNHMLLLIFLFFWAEYSRELFLQASLRLLNLLYLLADHIFELYYLEVHIKNKLCLKWERILFYDILERFSLKLSQDVSVYSHKNRICLGLTCRHNLHIFLKIFSLTLVFVFPSLYLM